MTEKVETETAEIKPRPEGGTGKVEGSAEAQGDQNYGAPPFHFNASGNAMKNEATPPRNLPPLLNHHQQYPPPPAPYGYDQHSWPAPPTGYAPYPEDRKDSEPRGGYYPPHPSSRHPDPYHSYYDRQQGYYPPPPQQSGYYPPQGYYPPPPPSNNYGSSDPSSPSYGSPSRNGPPPPQHPEANPYYGGSPGRNGPPPPQHLDGYSYWNRNPYPPPPGPGYNHMMPPGQGSPGHMPMPMYPGIAWIKDINENDVLCGRGGATNSHSGNRSYRKLVKKMKQKYLSAKKKDKPHVAGEVVDIIRQLDPPGRFLKKSKDTGWYVDIGDAKAKEKTSQALREGAPLMRKQMEDGTYEVEHTSDDDSVMTPPIPGEKVEKAEEGEKEEKEKKGPAKPAVPSSISTPAISDEDKESPKKRKTSETGEEDESPTKRQVVGGEEDALKDDEAPTFEI
ncbi:hypothetical protein CTEN210_07369 [Chaetoceros tenuissimus]|uniref:DUF6824 domain-containing protein n=1 Tax=Chaetoceros tenuissimus TaxID=426638 RepID=A0AAD3CS38_9STRA|nr:hypothetical protein CTEN210_07369 [Chaetoceros tenuissimus]